MRKVIIGRKRGIVAVLLAVVILLMPMAGFAAQNNNDVDASVATYSALDDIVGAQVDSVYGTIKGSVSDYAGQLVYDVIGNKENIKAMAKPLVSGAIKGELQKNNISNADLDSLIDRTVEQIVDNIYVDQILDNEFVQAVLARTARYATADIVERLHIDADKEQITANVISHIWNAGKVTVGTASTKVKSDLPVVAAAGQVINTSYYNFNVVDWNTQKVLFTTVKTTPKEINVTGWNRGNITTYISGTVGLNTASKYNEYASALSRMDYTSIILSAAQRAVKDEIKERILALYQNAKTEVVACLETKLANIGVDAVLNPADSFEKIAQDIESAVRAKATQDIYATFDYLWGRLTCS